MDASRARVALAIQHYPPYVAGAEIQACLLAKHLGMALGACDVVTTRFRGELPRHAHEGAVRIRRLRMWPFGRGRRIANFTVACLYFLFHGHRYEIVHTFCLSPFSLGALLGGRLRGVRVIARPCTTGAQGEVTWLLRSFWGRRLWALFLCADAFIVQTSAMTPELLAAGVAANRIACVPNLLRMEADESPDSISRARARAALGLPERPTVLFVGRLVEAKGLDALCAAWGHVIAELDASLVLVGDGPQAPALRQWIDDRGFFDSVVLAGQRPDPERYYRAADIFAFPSCEEGFGNALAEAMAFELAVVCRPVGLACDTIEDGRNGVLLRESSPEQLSVAIADLIRDATRRDRLGRAARETAVQRFTPDVVVRTVLDLYQRLGLASG